MKKLLGIFVLLSATFSVLSVPNADSNHAKKALEIYQTIIEIPTVAGRGNVPKMAKYLASEFTAAGFAAKDIQIIPKGETASLIVRYRGDGSSGKKPILLIGHMDVVEALAKDWERPPFKLTQDDNYFYGRGTIDNKYGITMLSATFIRLKNEGFIPNRDLIIAFSGDEETGMTTTQMLANDMPELAEAEFALNSDAGGGDLSADGKPVAYLVQAAEKTYATFELTIRNAGGHSSRPKMDNAIYDLADAITKIQGYHFPVQYSEMTRDFFRISGQKLGGELGQAMMQFANNPNNKAASDRLEIEPSYVGSTRTTCVPTMLKAGHAENALPQSAMVTVNCRIFPGTTVAQVQKQLKQAINNDAVEFVVTGSPVESPISEPRADVMAAISKAVHSRYPKVDIVVYMESGGTDGMHFRKAGIPTWAMSSAFMNPDDMFAHGLNERLPIKAFYGGLDHWTIILKALTGK
ncbi:M20/M25/M40 family metallo-hydrolase [Psychrosphaera sp. 1_MG-2023]|uniref:M20/M25/M40 family metallo-hydrolase n=1 Tax=Psychrosphaera sp. 1_MG-2023 TaxID=3062643 RepID=UPI0026E3BABA|nr:M20/M25/M40 family metallo-hydrolase [Psychrosphaera sp. 1_MG-2023]MDO6718960.1 M20/M25/M40 family metallo-hydrolase [Psychrosphaera sp. 1_MG-2023]